MAPPDASKKGKKDKKEYSQLRRNSVEEIQPANFYAAVNPPSQPKKPSPNSTSKTTRGCSNDNELAIIEVIDLINDIKVPSQLEEPRRVKRGPSKSPELAPPRKQSRIDDYMYGHDRVTHGIGAPEADEVHKFRNRHNYFSDTYTDFGDFLVPSREDVLDGGFSSAIDEPKYLSTSQVWLPTLDNLKGEVYEKYWDKSKEDQLRRDCLRLNFNTNQYEIALYGVMIQLYGATPWELFTYGLKLDPSSFQDYHPPARPQKDLHASSQTKKEPDFRTILLIKFSNRLRHVICHPVFERDLSLVRYALQMAVFFRVAGHTRPWGPVPAIDSLKNLVQESWLREKTGKLTQPDPEKLTKLANLAFAACCDFGPERRRGIKLLIKQIQKQVEEKKKASEYLTPPSSRAGECPHQEEKLLFLLTAEDVLEVRDALNSLSPWKDCQDYVQDFQSAYDISLCPPSQAELKDWKYLFLMADERNYRIRKAILEDQTDNDEKVSLYDKPPRDPEPLYVWYPNFDPASRAVLLGHAGGSRYPDHWVDEEDFVPRKNCKGVPKIKPLGVRCPSPDFLDLAKASGQ